MKKVILFDSEKYQLVSFANGWGYSLERKADNKSVWFQDDAATTFRESWEAEETAFPNKPIDSILTYFFDNYA